MQRPDLIRLLERRYRHLTHTQIVTAFDAIFGTIASEMSQGRHVTLTGFGRFETRLFAARSVDLNGEVIDLPDRRLAAFRCSHLLRRRLDS